MMVTDKYRNNAVASMQKILLLLSIGLVIGLIMAFVSNGFVLGVEWITTKREILSSVQFSLVGVTVSLAPLIFLLSAACIILLVRRVFRIDRYHGPADSIHAAHRQGNDLDLKSGLGSTLMAFISASGGASVGQYGPLVHFGTIIGCALRRLTGGSISTDIFIGCGVAGAIAAGFNAPLAGIVFAHEVILRHYSSRAIAPIAMSSITAAGVSHWAIGDRLLFNITAAPAVSFTDLLPAVLLISPVFALVAIFFMLTLRASTHLAATSRFSSESLLLTAALVCGLTGMFVPEILGFGTSAINNMFAGQFDSQYLFVLLVGKITMTAVCVGFGLFGGVVLPALFIGTAAGILGGQTLTMMGLASGPVIGVGGMAATAAAVIGAPVSTVILLFELTDSYQLAVAAMLSVAICTLITNEFFGFSFFDKQLFDRGIDIRQGRDHLQMIETPVQHYVSQHYVAVNVDRSLAEVLEAMVNAKVTEAYIVDASRRFSGKLLLHDVLLAEDNVLLTDLSVPDPITINHDASISQAIKDASNFIGESIPVINHQSRDFLGVVTEADLFQAYLAIQSQMRHLENN